MEGLFGERRRALGALSTLRGKGGRGEELVTCAACGGEETRETMHRSGYVCPRCGCHLRVSAQYRLHSLFDQGVYRELEAAPLPDDPLAFPGYREKLEGLRKTTGLSEAFLAGAGKVEGIAAVAGAMDSRFLMGSMGTAVGERVTQAAEYATKYRLPLILFCASGGARMQEGILSLMQMAKTAAALERRKKEGLFTVTVLTHPTTGGVTASFASLGDIILAEPGALIGFAGPRVIRQTIGQQLPEGFQRAEFLEQHGFVDRVVDRRRQRETLALLLRLHQPPAKRRKGGKAG